MTNRKVFMEFMREDLLRTRNYLFNIHEQGRPGDDPGSEIGPEFVLPKGMKPVKPFSTPYKPGTAIDLTTKPDEKPTKPSMGPRTKPEDPNAIDPNTGYPDGMEPPDPNGVIPIDPSDVPDWVWEHLGFNNLDGLPEGFSFGVQLHGPGSFIVILDENGQIVSKLYHWEGITLAFPPGAGIMNLTGADGVPLIYVPAGNDQDGYPSPAIYHMGQQYIEFLFGAFEGLASTDYPIYRGPNGQWYNRDADGNTVPWPPQEYDGPIYDPPADQSPDGIAGWWLTIPDWLRGILIAGVAGTAAWIIGTNIGDWIGGNNHVPMGPPVGPGGDDSDEGGSGGGGAGGGGGQGGGGGVGP